MRRASHADHAERVRQIAAPAFTREDRYAWAVHRADSLALDSDADSLALRWFTAVRWTTLVAGAGAVIAGRNALQAPAAVGPAVAALVAFAVSNVWLTWRARSASGGHLRSTAPLLMCVDVALLSWLLLRAGGVLNPASVFYLVEIVVAALVFGRRWTWIVASLSVAGYATLFLAPTDDLRAAQSMHPEIATHMQGMWLAFALTAIIIAALVTRLLGAIDRRDRALDTLRARNDAAMRAASLATLAAGAAHELSTPLATIAVAARELERSLAPSSDQALDDARLIRAEAGRCRAILDDLAGSAGQPAAESPRTLTVSDILDDVTKRLSPAERDRTRIQGHVDTAVTWPARPVARAMTNVVQNALQAAPLADVDIRVEASPGAQAITVRVADQGPGMTAEHVQRAGDPFFSTRAGGTGLGLFVARSTVEQLRGTLAVASTPGAGTVVTIVLPAHPGAPERSAP